MTDTMVRFRYEGETVEGETVKGEIKAPSSLAAVSASTIIFFSGEANFIRDIIVAQSSSSNIKARC